MKKGIVLQILILGECLPTILQRWAFNYFALLSLTVTYIKVLRKKWVLLLLMF